MFRIWSTAAGLPLGLLLALALPEAAGRWAWAAIPVGAIFVLAVVSWAARPSAHAVDRERQLARAASAALAALPAAGLAWLGLGPGAAAASGLVAALVLLAALHAARAHGPGPSPGGQLSAALGWLFGGACAFVLLAGLLAALRSPGAGAPPTEARAHYLFDLDAAVATQPLPRCQPAAERVEEVVRGARPALGSSALFFDAPGPEGRRQIHQMDLGSREVLCSTCGEPGQNVAPRPSGRVAVFETDRGRDLRRPLARQLRLLRPKGYSVPLTSGPGASLAGAIDPGGRALLWSRDASGSWALVTAPLRTGHGGVSLGSPTVLEPAGAGFVEALAWSPDARSLVIRRGGPLAPGPAWVLDPATGRRGRLADAAAVAASFSADGGTLAVATTRPAASVASLPAALDFLTSRLALLPRTPRSPHRGTGVLWGPPVPGELAPIELGGVADWGAPTGVALAPDGASFFLGQLRTDEGGSEERILRISLRCAGSDERL